MKGLRWRIVGLICLGIIIKLLGAQFPGGAGAGIAGKAEFYRCTILLHRWCVPNRLLHHAAGLWLLSGPLRL
ncbi:MAG: hypothetical protein JO076_14040 [Verrucomicrobia bacterium]|nr:hypothetical protein [Verrucomicrobiota bacterium]